MLLSERKVLKQQAISLRKDGYSYSLINQKLSVSNATLSDWLKSIPYKPNSEVLERMNRGRIKSSQTHKQLRINRIQKANELAEKELGKLSKRDLMILGIGLYIGEGGKCKQGCIQFSNSDPKVIKLAMEWFRKTLKISNTHFRAIVHIYPDNNIDNSIKFWSNITSIPIGQFNKTYVDRRTNKLAKNKRKLPYGTIDIRIRSLGNENFGVSLYRKILGWIDLVENNNFAGIV